MLMNQYKKRSSPCRDIRAHTAQTPAMAPCSTSFSSIHHRLSEKDSIRMRKPVVEKMRRDRINGCIEQLKVILEKEFQQQEPNSKLEKADILEMTVSFLRQQLQPGRRASVHFLSAGSSTEAPGAPLQQQQRASSSRGPVWRPW